MSFSRALVLLLSDLFLVALGTFFAFVLRDGIDIDAERNQFRLLYLAVSLGIALIVLLSAGVHRSVYRFANITDYLWLSSLSVLIVIGAVAVGFAVNRLEGVPRTLPVLQAILIIAFLIAARVGYRLLHARRMAARSAASHGFADAEEVLVVGVNALSDLFIRAVLDLAGGSIKVNGVLTLKQKTSRPASWLASDLWHAAGRPGCHCPLKIHGIIIQRLVIAVDRASLSSADQAMLTRLQEAEGIQLDYFADRLGLVARPVRQAKREDEQARQMRADYVSRTGLYRYGSVFLISFWPVFCSSCSGP